MQPFMVNSTQMSVQTIHSQLCPLASLKVQWRERRTLTQSQPADNLTGPNRRRGKGGKLQSAKCTMNPPLSQVMTEQSFKMSRCGEACGKTSELNSKWGGRKNTQTDMLSSVAFLTFYFKRKSFPSEAMFKRRISSNVWCAFIAT